MADPVALEQDGHMFATRAVTCDQNGLYETAIFYYVEAAQALLSASLAGSKVPNIVERANEYINRSEHLKRMKQNTSNNVVCKTEQQLNCERAEFLLRQAFDVDEKDDEEEAVELYTQAVELCLKIRQSTTDQTTQNKFTKLAEQALDRAEQLKGKISKQKSGPTVSDSPQSSRAQSSASNNRVKPRPLGDALIDDEGSSLGAGSVQTNAAKTVSKGGGYTKEEINVLRTTSLINGREYVPFMVVDIRERFGFPVQFTDKHGKLALSPKQKRDLAKWVRPEDISDNPQMIYAISSFSIRQTVVSDCSFVASLAISAQYERRFRKKLITSIIYPQNKHGDPQYNPCGKYMIKLNINGVPRKVIIDDYLPASRDGRLLCSYSNNRNELWVSLMEKAYMKVMGGYDFPGSNSNIDLHALTGWIPERVGIRPGTAEYDADKEFKKILDRFHQGHCLVTVATGNISEGEADRAGLVPTHAYAMLDIREVKGYKLFQLKNPWSHLRWKGNFSEKDVNHWTPDMKKLLNYDPESAQNFDNGVFWIDYESVQKYFDVIYINWNPELFPHTTCIHHTWTAKDGPKMDAYNVSDNPQYRLVVNSSSPAAVWILLTRHITDKDDFADNKEFITVLVYKSGKRIFYPFDPPPYKDGIRINSPHYLCKMVEKPGTSSYTLVIAQYEKNNTIHYTLRVYASCEFSLSKIRDPYNPKKKKVPTATLR